LIDVGGIGWFTWWDEIQWSSPEDPASSNEYEIEVGWDDYYQHYTFTFRSYVNYFADPDPLDFDHEHDASGDGISDADTYHLSSDPLIDGRAHPLRKDVFVEVDWMEGVDVDEDKIYDGFIPGLKTIVYEDDLKEGTSFREAFEDANESMERKLTIEEVRIGQIWGSANNDGYGKRWHCSFSVPKNHTHRIGFDYTVYGDESIELINKRTYPKTNGNPIENWTIDSDEAVEIAKQEPEIESYLDEYPRASLGMTLKMWERLPDGRESPNQDSATWSIGWEYMGGMFEDPAHARVFINANTGEVLYVDGDE